MLARLVERADVLMENFRVGVLDRLGFPVVAAARAQPAADRPLDHRLRPRRAGGQARRLRPDRAGRGRADVDHRDRAADQGGRADRRPDRRDERRLRGARRPARAGARPAAAGSSARRCWPGWSACTPSRAPAGPSPARCRAWPATTTPRSRRTACSRRRPRRCRSPAARRACGARCAAPSAGTRPRREFATNPLRVANRDALVDADRDALRRPSRPSTGWRCSSDAGVPSGKVRTMDDVYTWDQTLSQGLLLSVDHATQGELKLPGLADPLRRQPVLRRPLRAPRSPDARPARRVDPGVAGLVSTS